MKSLLIDAGNSYLKWLVYENGIYSSIQRFNYSNDKVLTQLMDNIPVKLNPQRICVSNVAGKKFAGALIGFCERNWHIEPEFATSTRSFNGLENAYLHPEKLGVDRWLGLIAATSWFKKPFLVVDCGTAVTLDAVDEKGTHLGGLILPGFNAMVSSLNLRTSEIDVHPENFAETLFANNTTDAVTNGAINAITALMEKLMKQLLLQTKAEPTCILTGGDANTLQQRLPFKSRHEPYLIFKGLVEVFSLH